MRRRHDKDDTTCASKLVVGASGSVGVKEWVDWSALEEEEEDYGLLDIDLSVERGFD